MRSPPAQPVRAGTGRASATAGRSPAADASGGPSPPDGPSAADLLASEGVDYLLVAGPAASGSDLGGYRPFETDHESLAHSGRYTLVRTFGDGRLSLYHVDTAS